MNHKSNHTSALSAPSAVQLLSACLTAMAGCGPRGQGPALFELLPPARTGVTFVNALPEDTAFNIINYLYYYNGGGVAAGDVDNDGLPDLYFTSSLGSNRLYRNLGHYRFEDITERAGVADPEGWKTGVTMADVNGDGYLDLYVSAVSYLGRHGHNVLYINNGDGTFTDRTTEYGLDFAGYSTQAVFFDYDGDGDLDMYLLNHSTHGERAPSAMPQRQPRHPRAGDRLFRNDRNHFVDVSQAAGIYGGVEGYGLGVVASDVNLDGCPDLYVGNDFQEDDFLYLNNCDGTFTESLTRAMGHTSRASMGLDAADFNNDGRPDVMVLDMWPEEQEVLNTSANAESFELHDLRLKFGYHPQYPRNTLQLNRGAGRFSEIAYLAGVYATDWSWAPLFADLDNDGWKDLFITTGIYRRPNDMDYITYVGGQAMQASLREAITSENLALLLKRMPRRPVANYAYRNNRDLTFTNMARAWGLDQPGFSNGAVYVDLSRSGALDLVVNNLNAPAAIYRNRAHEISGAHDLAVRLKGSGANTDGIGTKVRIVAGGMRQMLEQMPTRGYQSSVEPRLHFGLGAAAMVDTLVVIWPDRRYQVLANVAADQTVTLAQEEAAGRYDYREGQTRQKGQKGQGSSLKVPAASPVPSAPSASSAPSAAPLFTDITDRLSVSFTHKENPFYDYHREPFMPHQLSAEGPALAVGDVNGDGLDDIYVGGAKWQAGRLFIQQRDGAFRPGSEPVFRADSLAEDVDAAFFDADADGDLDLYVVSGGNEFWGDAEALRDRLYINDGHGNVRRDREALPAFFANGGCVAPGDFNGDGHPDLFVGSRVESRAYGKSPRSYLLRNDGSGRFVDVTIEKAPALAEAGMISAAAWTDYDGDGRLDLVVVGEWMPVRVFRQEGGRLVDRTAEAGLSGTEGWWNTVAAADLRGTGREDLVLGNLGLNSYIRASAAEPARLYLYDFAHNGGLVQILTFYKKRVSYPLVGRDELIQWIPQLRAKYPSYASFGASRMEDIFPAQDLRQATVLEARTFASAVALNQGDGTYHLAPLPTEVQFAPVYAALPGDVDGDGHPDLLVAGNDYGVPPVQGRYDAGYGLLLLGDGAGRFAPVDLEASGLAIQGQVRGLKWLGGAGGSRLLAAARNNDGLEILRLRKPQATTQ